MYRCPKYSVRRVLSTKSDLDKVLPGCQFWYCRHHGVIFAAKVTISITGLTTIYCRVSECHLIGFMVWEGMKMAHQGKPASCCHRRTTG